MTAPRKLAKVELYRSYTAGNGSRREIVAMNRTHVTYRLLAEGDTGPTLHRMGDVVACTITSFKVWLRKWEIASPDPS